MINKEKDDMKMEKFTKDMLEDSMVAETRNGVRYLVCGNKLIGMDRVIYLFHYDNDLSYYDNIANNKNYDIVKVYGKVECLRQIVSPLCLHLLWERHDVKEVTLKEIAEKFGVDEVKVIDD